MVILRPFSLIAFCLLFSRAFSESLLAANAPAGLLCNLLEHPEETVITAARPGFGWIYNPSFRNDYQTAYRIVVASDPSSASQGVGNVWDSGFVSNSVSINVPYAGAALQTSTDYYWCVQTMDSAGNTSAFSPVQHFHTDTQLHMPPVLPVTTNGLQWIWYPESPAATYATRYFRKTFVVSTNPAVAGAQILLTADDQFTLYVNGRLIGGGSSWKQFDYFSLGSLIQPGTNTIAIAASNILSAAGVIGRLDYRGADGSANTIYTDGTWLTSSNLTANWNQPGFDDSSWVNASVLGGYGVAPWYALAVLPPTGLVYNSSTNIWANRYPLRYMAAAPVSIVNTAPQRWFIDFGQDAFGYATVHANGSHSGTTIQARFGEMAGGSAVNTAPPSGSSVRYASTNFTLQNGNVVYPVYPPVFSYPAGAISPPTNYGVVMPFRYFELTNFPGLLTSTDVTQERLFAEFNTNAASFNSSSPALNQIWNLCKVSMQVFTFDGIYADGDRERKPYEADSYIHQLSTYGVDREFNMLRCSFEYLLQNPTWPTEWKFHMILIAWADYMQTGDTNLLYCYYDTLKASDLFYSRATGNGLIQGFPNFPQSSGNSDIVDWAWTPDGDRDGFVIYNSSNGYLNWTNSVNNAFYYRCLQIMSNIATIIGRTNDAATYASAATQVYNSYNATFWNKSSHSYVDGVGTNHSAIHANFFPLVFGLVPASNVSNVVSYIHSRLAASNVYTNAIPTSVYGAQYLLESLFDAGDADTAIGLMTTNGPRSWMNMINMGSTLTTESWNFADKSNMDWNHPWGSAPGNLIPRFILGLRPITPGYGQVLIQPQLGSMLSWAQGVVPTIRGPVSIMVTNASGQYQLLINIPGNVTATVMLPAVNLVNPVALVDGKIVSGAISNNCLVVTNVGSGLHAVWISTNGAPVSTLYNNWASGWFGTNATNAAIAGPSADPDGDGVDNYLEFIAGTDPLDANDTFHITDFSYDATGPVAKTTVLGQGGRHYTLQHTISLVPPAWVDVTTQTATVDSQPIQLIDSTFQSSSNVFLRVVVTYP